MISYWGPVHIQAEVLIVLQTQTAVHLFDARGSIASVIHIEIPLDCASLAAPKSKNWSPKVVPEAVYGI